LPQLGEKLGSVVMSVAVDIVGAAPLIGDEQILQSIANDQTVEAQDMRDVRRNLW